MRLSKSLVRKYISYRSRYLYGSNGVYRRSGCSSSCLDPNIIFQEENQPVTFLRHSTDSSRQIGSFLNVDFLRVADKSNPETATITDIKHGDNLIYCAFSALNFASEYSITLQTEPLELCLSIIESFQRLGKYQKGFNESAAISGPHGFMLRSDSPDENNLEENICEWLLDSDKSRNLEPSYDQYCGLLSCLRMIQLIVSESDAIPEHSEQIRELNNAISERIQTSVNYLAGSYWTILWKNKNNELRVAKRGPFCIHAAYPFSKIAVLSLSNRLEDYFLGEFPFGKISGFNETAVLDKFGQAVRSVADGRISDEVRRVIESHLVNYVVDNVIGGAIGEILRFVESEQKVTDEVKSAIRDISEVLNVIDNISEYLIEKLLTWTGFLIGLAAIPLSVLLHRYYSKYMLQGLDDAFILKLGDLLDILGINRPANPGLDFPISISFEVGDSPSWWPDIWSWDGWKKEFLDERVKIELSLNLLWEIPIPIGILDPLSIILAGAGENLEKKHDLQLLLFLNNVAADTFDENLIDPVETSYDNNNCMMMASTYRMFPEKFEGTNKIRNLRKFQSVMSNIESAPEDYPNNDLINRPWNQNFRWMRGEKSEDPNEREIYAGMDFMLPLMLVASKRSDVEFNRALLLEAMAPTISEVDQMGPFKLPFQGPYNGEKIIFSPKAGGTQNDTIIYIGVVFDRGRGVGEVLINYSDLSGNKKSEVFSPNDPGKMIAVPLKDDDVNIELTSDLKGYFLIQSSE